MRNICLSSYIKSAKNAGPKAKTDVEKILSDKNFVIETISINNTGKINKILRIINAVVLSIKYFRNNLILIQSPLELWNLENKLFINNNMIVIFIHDIEGLRKQDCKKLNKELQLYNNSKYVISHNKNMSDFLIRNGIAKEKILTLTLFDYLANDNDNNCVNFNEEIVYAGNPKKSPFIYQIDEKKIKYTINIYGIGIKCDINGKVKYKGSFQADNLPNEWNGSVGLVWDGNFDESDENEGFKNYTKYNNPHKLSCYIAAGIPVIVWRKSAVSDFVISNNIGYVISNIYDINNIDFSDYSDKKKNVDIISKRVKDGYYTKKTINKIIK